MLALLLAAASLGASAEPSLLSSLQQLVEINSGSANVAGVDRVQALVGEQLKKLGFTLTLENHLLLATLKGERPETVTFITHADTVFEPSSGFLKLTLSDQNQIAHGPGVIDDKGGIVVAVEAIRRYLAAGPAHFSLRFLVSPSEEIGSPGLKEEFQKMAQDSWLVLSFEPALDDGSAVASRNGNRWYKIKVMGHEAHAGRAHKEGANACLALADKLVAVSKLTDYARHTTVSVGHIEGGKDKFNIVCGVAEAKLDTRFASLAERDRLSQKIEHIVQREDVAKTRASFEITDESPPLVSSPRAKRYMDEYLAQIKAVEGGQPTAQHSGGSADSNQFSREGLVILDGLGPVGGKMHTQDEFLKVSSLETRAEAVSRLLGALKM